MVCLHSTQHGKCSLAVRHAANWHYPDGNFLGVSSRAINAAGSANQSSPEKLNEVLVAGPLPRFLFLRRFRGFSSSSLLSSSSSS